MVEEAVVLTYLEWIRLIERTWIRLDKTRIVRYESNQEDYTDVVCDLMSNVPDVGASSTDFVLAALKPVVLDRLRVRPSDIGEQHALEIGERLTLDAVNAFHSFTENALAVHEHDALTRNIPIGLSSRAFADAWHAWSKALTDIAADFRGKALLSKLHLTMARGYHLADAMGRLSSPVKPDEIAKSQDTMFFGWACILNAIKYIDESALPSDCKEEIYILRGDFDTNRPFLSCAPKLRSHFEQLRFKPPSRLLDWLGHGNMSHADFFAIAALKHYERCNVKSDGNIFNYQCFQNDVRYIESMNKEAAAFLAYQMGTRLSDRIVAPLATSQQARPIPSSADEGKEVLDVRGKAAANPAAEAVAYPDSMAPVETSPLASDGAPNPPPATRHPSTEQEVPLCSSISRTSPSDCGARASGQAKSTKNNKTKGTGGKNPRNAVRAVRSDSEVVGDSSSDGPLFGGDGSDGSLTHQGAGRSQTRGAPK